MLAYARTTRAQEKGAGDVYKCAHFFLGGVVEAKKRDLDDLQLLRCHHLHLCTVKQVN